MKPLRLKKNSGFERVFSKGKKFYGKDILLICIFGRRPPLVGFSVSKKHGGAVKRNRIKRLLRAAFFNVCAKFELHGHFVFIPKVCENYTYQSYQKQMAGVLQNAGFKTAVNL